MKLVTTIESIKKIKGEIVWVTTAMIDGIEIDADLEEVMSEIQAYFFDLGYIFKAIKEDKIHPIAYHTDLSVNHIQNCWEVTVTTSDRLYLRLMAGDTH